MGPDEPDVNNPESIIDPGHQAIFVPANVENRALIFHNACITVFCLHIRWPFPIGFLCLSKPGLQLRFGRRFALPKLFQRLPCYNAHTIGFCQNRVKPRIPILGSFLFRISFATRTWPGLVGAIFSQNWEWYGRCLKGVYQRHWLGSADSFSENLNCNPSFRNSPGSGQWRRFFSTKFGTKFRPKVWDKVRDKVCEEVGHPPHCPRQPISAKMQVLRGLL